MDFTLKLSSVSPSSLYISDFLSPKSNFKQLTLQSSPVFGRCISEIKISSEKSSPLPTPITMNFSKPKTPTCVSISSIVIKRPERVEQKTQKKESVVKVKLPKPKKKKLEKRKFENKKEIEVKLDPAKEKVKKTLETHRVIKELGKNIRKMNLKFSKKRFVQKEKWALSSDQTPKLSVFDRIPSILLKKKKKSKFSAKPSKKKITKKHSKTPLLTHREPSPLLYQDSFKSAKSLKRIIKIQAFVRGWLVRRKVKYLREPKYSIEFSNHISIIQSSSQSHMPEDIEVQNILKQKPENSFSHLLPSLTPSVPLTNRSRTGECPNPSKQFMISAEIALKHKQNSELHELQQHDMQEMKAIAERFSNKAEIIEVFSHVIQRRYAKLSSFFEQSIQKLEEHLNRDENPEEMERFSAFDKERPDHTAEIGYDIEKILMEIEQFEESDENSFLCDPQPLPPLTPIYEDVKPYSLKYDDVRNPSSPNKALEFDFKNHSEVSLCEEYPESLKRFFAQQKSFAIDLVMAEEEPSACCLNAEKGELEGIKDSFSVTTGILGEITEDSGSVQRDLENKPALSIKKTVWPSSRYKVPEQHPSKNPFSQTSPASSTVDLEFNLIFEHVTSLLELTIYHDLLENISSIFEDHTFILSLTEHFIHAAIHKLVIEATDPKPLSTLVKADSINLLQTMDKEFTKILKTPKKLIKKLQKFFSPTKILFSVQSNTKMTYLNVSLFPQHPLQSDSFLLIHQNALHCACSQAILLSISSQQTTIFDFVHSKIATIKLSDFFVSIREILYRWNELQAGNLPSEETQKPDGDLDEDKLQSLRIQSLAKLLYQDLEEDDLQWTNYLFEEEQSIIDLEKSIFADLLLETIPFLFFPHNSTSPNIS